MHGERDKLKTFIERHIPFDELKEAEFWEKGTRKTDYEKIAARICRFFGFETIYDYAAIEIHQPTPTVVTGSFPGKVDKSSNLVSGGTFLLDVCETEFDCPICTCRQDAINSRRYRNSKGPICIITCSGCKRKLQLYNDLSGKLFVSEVKRKDAPGSR